MREGRKTSHSASPPILLIWKNLRKRMGERETSMKGDEKEEVRGRDEACCDSLAC